MNEAGSSEESPRTELVGRKTSEDDREGNVRQVGAMEMEKKVFRT